MKLNIFISFVIYIKTSYLMVGDNIEEVEDIEKCFKSDEQLLFREYSFSQLYAAFNQKGDKVLIKRIELNIEKEKLEKRFEALKNLDNENIVKIIDKIYFENNFDHKFLIFEYFEGVSIRTYLSNIKGENLPYETLLKILKGVVLAIKYLHKNRFFGLSLSLDNIYYDENRIKLCVYDLNNIIHLDNQKTECTTMRILIKDDIIAYCNCIDEINAMNLISCDEKSKWDEYVEKISRVKNSAINDHCLSLSLIYPPNILIPELNVYSFIELKDFECIEYPYKLIKNGKSIDFEDGNIKLKIIEQNNELFRTSYCLIVNEKEKDVKDLSEYEIRTINSIFECISYNKLGIEDNLCSSGFSEFMVFKPTNRNELTDKSNKKVPETVPLIARSGKNHVEINTVVEIRTIPSNTSSVRECSSIASKSFKIFLCVGSVSMLIFMVYIFANKGL